MAGVIGLAVLATGLPCLATAAPKIPLARAVDVNRLSGGWHIVATIPNSFERGMVAPYDVYSPRPDGSIREDFYVRHGAFSAPVKHFVVRDFVKPGTGGAFWLVQILWPIRLPFLVLYVDPDYRYVIFGEDNRKLGWIYARESTLSDGEYQDAFTHLAAVGYDPHKFRKIIQTPEQIGQPGFWNDGVRPSEATQGPTGKGATHGLQ